MLTSTAIARVALCERGATGTLRRGRPPGIVRGWSGVALALGGALVVAGA